MPGTIGLVNDIVVSGGTVFAVGYVLGADYYPMPTVWQNGVETQYAIDNSSDYNTANAVAVAGSDLYVTGSYASSSGLLLPCYWLNGTRCPLDIPSRAHGYSEGITISANNIYIAGYYIDSDNTYHATYWKNGKRTDLNGLAAGTGSWCYGIASSSSEEIVVSGTVQTSAGQWKPALWTNGTLSVLSVLNSSRNAEAEYCAITE